MSNWGDLSKAKAIRAYSSDPPSFGGATPVVKDRSAPTKGHYSKLYTVTVPGGVESVVNEGTLYASPRHEYSSGSNHPGWRAHWRLPWIDFGGSWLKYDVIVPSAAAKKYCVQHVAGLDSIFDGYVTASQETSDCVSKKLTGNVTGDISFFTSRCPAALSGITLDQKGSSAIAACAPTNPTVDMATALLELYHDGLPSLPTKSLRSRSGNIGDEYLNLQFGWSPTIQDGRDFIKAIRNHDETVTQFLRDIGKPVRRGMHFPQVSGSSSVTQGSRVPGSMGAAYPTGSHVQVGTLSTNTFTSTDTWFEAEFIYFVPESAFGKRIAVLDKTYGLRPGIDTAWELTPWSWLFDWFTNTGTVLKNLNSFLIDGLVMRRGYVMSTSTITKEMVWKGNMRNRAGTFESTTLTDSVTYQTKQRRGANPFGFGLTYSGLSPFKLSILAALGLSRAH